MFLNEKIIKVTTPSIGPEIQRMFLGTKYFIHKKTSKSTLVKYKINLKSSLPLKYIKVRSIKSIFGSVEHDAVWYC